MITEYRLKVPSDTWDEFKDSLDDGQTINEKLNELITKELQNRNDFAGVPYRGDSE